MLDKNAKYPYYTENLNVRHSSNVVMSPLTIASNQQQTNKESALKNKVNTATLERSKNLQLNFKDKAGLLLAIILMFFIHVLERIKLLR
jgi:hypothetical protein